MMIPTKDYTDVLWSTPIQIRHDSGYKVLNTFECNIDLSPIRKKAPCTSNLAVILENNGVLETGLDRKVNNEINKVNRKLFINYIYSTETISPRQVDSGIESMCKTADGRNQSEENSSISENQSLYCNLRSFPKDLSCDFLQKFANSNNNNLSQPSKYICKEDSSEFKCSTSDLCSSQLLDENNNKINNILLLKRKSLPVTDFLHELSVRNCTSIVSNILSYLPNEDLRNATNVSKTWQSIVFSDKRANKRRTDYINNKRNTARGPNKENRFQKTNDFGKRCHKSVFHNIMNASKEVTQQPLYNDNLVGRFDSFCQVVKILNNKDKLMKCPKCQYPSKMVSENIYCCTRNLCQHEFCKKCNGPYLDNHLCSEPKFNPSLPNIFIGSKKSKNNLRRL